MAKKSSNHNKKEIEISTETGVKALIDFANSPEGKEFPIFPSKTSGAEGVTGGRFLDPHEIEGEDLPPKNDNHAYQEFQINFDVRLAHDGNGNIELFIAKKRARTYFKFPLKGLDARQAIRALIDFDQSISKVITYAIQQHASVCYRKQDENRKRRKETYDKLKSVLEYNLKTRLDLWRYKEPKVENKGGVKIKTFEAIQGGRDKGAKNLRAKITIDDVIKEIKKFKGGYTFPTQAIIARRLKVNRNTIQRCLKNAGIKERYTDYAHSIISS